MVIWPSSRPFRRPASPVVAAKPVYPAPRIRISIIVLPSVSAVDTHQTHAAPRFVTSTSGYWDGMHPKTLVTTIGAVFATAALGGLASRPAEPIWHSGLTKPSFQPPRQALPTDWPILQPAFAAWSGVPE